MTSTSSDLLIPLTPISGVDRGQQAPRSQGCVLEEHLHLHYHGPLDEAQPLGTAERQGEGGIMMAYVCSFFQGSSSWFPRSADEGLNFFGNSDKWIRHESFWGWDPPRLGDGAVLSNTKQGFLRCLVHRSVAAEQSQMSDE